MANKRYIPKFQEGGYFGGEAMVGEQGRDIRNLADAWKSKERVFQKGMAKRKKWGGISDFFEKVVGKIPGYGKFLQPMLDVFSEQQIQKRIGVKGGPDLRELETMWTGGEGTASQEEWEKVYGASDVSLWEGLMRGAGDFISSDEGSEFIFGREGGRVPKYKKGGRAPKKEDIEGFKALYDLFSKGQPTVKSGKPMFTKEGGYSKDYFAEELGLNPEEMSIDTLSYQDPRNFEFEITGDGRKVDLSQKGNIWPRRSTYDKKERMMRSDLKENIGDENYMRIMNELNPEGYDTLLKKVEDKYFDMDRFKQMDYDMKNFKQGGQVPQYYGGGSVSGIPTIAGYFNQQGKTLGGSNTQSLAEKLGMK